MTATAHNRLRFVDPATTPSPRYGLTDSPVGELRLVSDGVALSGVYLDGAQYTPELPTGAVRDDAAFASAIGQLEEYFAGERRAFELEIAPVGTAFQLSVWRTLAEIPYGATRTYLEIAVGLGRPKAPRAVGSANGHNPISIILPCHRVIGSNGGLTGYAGGLDRKALLLDLEKKSAAAD